jgi:zinc transport system ATP-binding protein
VTTSATSALPSTASSQPLLELRDVTVAFGGEPALETASLCLHTGEFVGIIGQNGAGKTTLLKTILGLQKPTSGDVIRSQNVRTGYIPQRGAHYSGIVPISVLEVVKLGSQHSSAAQALQALAQVQMESFANRIFTELSGGQQQRVSIAKALAGNAGLLILDEPTTGIDERSQTSFYALLRSLQEKGITILMVSHEVDTVLSLVTRVICLNQQVVYDGPPEHFESDKHLPNHNQRIHLHHNHQIAGAHHV